MRPSCTPFVFDHQKLGFLWSGTNMTLTDSQDARVVHALLA